MSGIIRNSLTKIVPTVRTHMTQKATVVSGPPKNPMSMTEKLVTASIMSTIILSPMLYIMTNVKHYRGVVPSD